MDVKGAEGTSSYYFTAGQTSGLIAVNEGTYTVSMCANFSGEKGLYCDAQSIDADWADGLKLTAPVVSVSQSDTYNYADISWTAVDGAEEYFVTVEGNGETRTASIQATSVTLQLAGEGSYTILVRARKSVTGAINGYILGEAGVTATTFAWSDAAKYTPKMTLVLGDNANELIVAWDEVPDAEKYVVTVYGENDGWLQTANTTYLAATIHVNGGETVRAEGYSYGSARRLAEELCRDFLDGKYDRLGIVSTRYESMMTQEARVDYVLPLGRQEGVGASGTVFEPDEATVLDAAIPEYVAGLLIHAVRESFASEVAARRCAMDSAGKNAEEMIHALELEYNRARQGAITQEITEIVAGGSV